MGIRNYKELSQKLNNALGKCMDKLTYRSHWIVERYLDNYYEEYEPTKYKRTGQFYSALTMNDLMYNHGEWYSSVYMDYKDMYYTYYSNKYDKYFEDDGMFVLESADRGYHSAEHYIDDIEDRIENICEWDYKHRFWSDSIVDIWNDEVIGKFKIQLHTYTGCKVDIVNGYYMMYER